MTAGLSGQTTEHILVPTDVAAGHNTGSSVAVRGDVAVVGAYQADIGTRDTGAAYVFEFESGAWTQTARLVASDSSAGHLFGSAVAIDDRGTIVVGAEGANSARGAAYVFAKSSGSWVQTARLEATGGGAGDHFGFAAAVDGDTILVGAWGRDGVTGATYVFERGTAGWQQTAMLTASDGAAVDYFGYTVSLDGDTALIGAPGDDDVAVGTGSAYVFTRQAGAWTQTAKLRASDAAAGDLLALSGSLSQGTIVLGARGNDDQGDSSGSAYIFEQVAGTWTETAKLLPGDGRAGDVFGHAVAIRADRIVIGAKWRDDTASTAGAAYLFTRQAGTWTQTTRLNASDARSGDAFGQAVAIDHRAVLVGSWRRASNRGAGYLFHDPLVIDADRSTIAVAPGEAKVGERARVTVTPRQPSGALAGTGLTVTISTTLGAMIGSVTDVGDGTYTQEIEASVTGTADITATARGVDLTNGATLLVKPKILGKVVGLKADGSPIVYRSIQHAVCNARRHALRRIVVAPGTYEEVVRIRRLRDLRLETIPGLGLTTIRGLRIWGSCRITVDGFQIESKSKCRAGIAMHFTSAVTLRNTLVRGARGHGIALGLCNYGTMLDRCLVETCGRTGIRVGHFVRDLRILRSIVRSNGDSGIHLSRWVRARLEGCSITDNGRRSMTCRRRAARGYGVVQQRLWRSFCRWAKPDPKRVTLIGNTVRDNRGTVKAGRSTADFGHYDQYIDATDDQAPFRQP